ncbi:MAG: hypothetical protein WAK29_21935, partial [Terriglobales bacterium]
MYSACPTERPNNCAKRIFSKPLAGCGKTPLRAGLGKGTTGVPGKPGFGLLGWTSSTRAVNAAPST